MSADQAMIDGVRKFLAHLASLTVGSQTVTPADIVKVFQDRLDAGKAVQTADAARTAAVKVERDGRAKTAAFVQALRRIVLGTFQQSPDTLAVFGLKAPKVVKKKVDVKAAAVVKSKATRTARHTTGKKAKLAIKGAPPAATSGPTAPPAPPAKPSA
jgi:cell division septation protein DedD